MRDSQRQRVYDAERFSGTAFREASEYLDLEGCQQLANRILREPVLARGYGLGGRQPTRIMLGRKGMRKAVAYSWDNRIVLASAMMQTWVICHEMAHIITNHHYSDRAFASHGWEFCSVYLDVVHFIMGREAADALKESFKKKRVKFKPPVKRNWSPEQREAAAERMRQRHAAKRSSSY